MIPHATVGAAMIDHLSLPVADIDRARTFYDAALAPLGHRRLMRIEEEGYLAFGYGPRDPEARFWIGGPREGQGPSTMAEGFHIAFTAADRGAVDGFYRAALAAGARDNGPPGLRPHYHPDYYAAFVIDPDGHHLEAVCLRPE